MNLLVFIVCLGIVVGRRRRGVTVVVPAVLAGVSLVGLLRMVLMVPALLEFFEAVAQVNPSDKATILAAGISEAIGGFAAGLVVMVPVLLGAYLVDRSLRERQLRQLSAESPGHAND